MIEKWKLLAQTQPPPLNRGENWDPNIKALKKGLLIMGLHSSILGLYSKHKVAWPDRVVAAQPCGVSKRSPLIPRCIDLGRLPGSQDFVCLLAHACNGELFGHRALLWVVPCGVVGLAEVVPPLRQSCFPSRIMALPHPCHKSN